jgi:biopolymer transport protein ExbB
VAGPVGEALIMTGIGLAVAIPAVVAYNAFNRGNRVLNARLDAFAFELLTFLSTGSTLADNGRDRGGDAAAVRPLRPAAA